jgi:hypothetical protein
MKNSRSEYPEIVHCIKSKILLLASIRCCDYFRRDGRIHHTSANANKLRGLRQLNTSSSILFWNRGVKDLIKVGPSFVSFIR